jgi:hypothetical protein
MCRTLLAATTAALFVRWPTENASTFELQLWSANASSGLAQTADKPAMLLHDLQPGTEYLLATRSRSCGADGCRWSALSEASACATLPLLPGQPRVLPPTVEPTLTSVHVSLEPPTVSAAAAFLLQFRKVASSDWDAAAAAAAGAPPPLWSSPTRVDTTSWVLDGLAPASTYEVRAIALLANSTGLRARGPPSEPTRYSTADDLWTPLPTYRVSELCGATCQPDDLAEHVLCGSSPRVLLLSLPRDRCRDVAAMAAAC